jgi:type IV secretion system protein VirB11
MGIFKPGALGLLAPIQHLLDNPKISEILINKEQEVWFEAQGKFFKEMIPEFTSLHLKNLFQLIANESEQTINKNTPLLSGSLSNGMRVQLCVPPTAKHHTLSIRKQSFAKSTLDDFANSNFYSKTTPTPNTVSQQEQQLQQLYQEQNWHELINQAIKIKKNIVISGGTSAGKTTYLNACLQAININERLVILEDTREVNAPHPNQVQLLANKNEQGLAKVSMQDLVQCSLRLRPDRIIMGEIRGAEIMDFVSACSTGHPGSLTTIHANNPKQAFDRMTQLYKLNNVPSMTDKEIQKQLRSVIDIIVQLEKTPQGRRATSIYFNQINC